MSSAIVYYIAGVIPAFLVFYQRKGRSWGIVAWCLGALTAELAACALALGGAAGATASAAILGGALPAAILMPMAGIWFALRLSRLSKKHAH